MDLNDYKQVKEKIRKNAADRNDLRRLTGLFCRLEAVLQADGAVEYQMIGTAILAVGAEVAKTHELVGGRSLGGFQAGFHLAAGEDLQRIKIIPVRKGIKA